MFEALISQVKSGRVKRKLFETLSAAEAHVAREKDKLLNRKRKGVPCPVSLGDYRMEVIFRECAAILAVDAGHRKARAA
jgi:hypothetical protein